jgi:phage terminase Nu1 subunit (DNA packaging protein)
LVTESRGRYLLAESVAGYCRALRERAASVPGGEAILAQERAQTLRIRNQIRLRQLELLQTESLSIEEAGQAWSVFARMIRQAVEAIPSRAGHSLPALTPHDLATINTLCRDILHDLASEAEGVIAANPKDLLHACL